MLVILGLLTVGSVGNALVVIIKFRFLSFFSSFVSQTIFTRFNHTLRNDNNTLRLKKINKG